MVFDIQTSKWIRLYDGKAAGPVEELLFEVDGISMTDIVYPLYFETFHKRRPTRFDHMGKLKRSFEMRKCGCPSFGIGAKAKTARDARAKKARLLREGHCQHRSTFRHRAERKSSTACWSIPRH